VGAGDVAVDGPSSTVDLPGGGSLTLERSQRSVTDPVSDHVLPLALLAVLLSVAAGLLGVVAARRVTRPLDQLVGLAADLGAGRFDTAVPRSREPEVDELGQALADAGRHLEQLVARERTLAVNASHELRTPITALRLSLEDLTLWPQVTQDVREELERAIAEVDRLGVAVTELLEGRRDEAREAEVDVDLHAVACEAARSWRGRLAEQGRRLVLEESTPVPARIVVQPVQQVVDALVEHAATEGSGTVTLDVTALRTVLRVRVTDQGARRVPSGVLHGDDAHARAAGLAESATTVEALGGYLAAEDTGTSSLLLVLPRRPTDG
jgi:signal transduction histidine kinase